MRQTIFPSLRHFIFPNLCCSILNRQESDGVVFSVHQPWQTASARCGVPGDGNSGISYLRHIPTRMPFYRASAVSQGQATTRWLVYGFLLEIPARGILGYQYHHPNGDSSFLCSFTYSIASEQRPFSIINAQIWNSSRSSMRICALTGSGVAAFALRSSFSSAGSS